MPETPRPTCECGNAHCLGSDGATMGHYYRLYEREKSAREVAEAELARDYAERRSPSAFAYLDELKRRTVAAESAREVAEKALAEHEHCIADNDKAFNEALDQQLNRAEAAESALTEERTRALEEAAQVCDTESKRCDDVAADSKHPRDVAKWHHRSLCAEHLADQIRALASAAQLPAQLQSRIMGCATPLTDKDLP